METKIKILIIMVALFVSIPLVFAATTYSSSNVVTDNKTTKWSIYLQDAIDDINYFCSINCPQGKICKNNTPKCRRATNLHTENCANSNEFGCKENGYELNDIITYGNTTTISGVLTTGDAFDCDVNGDGVYDSATERFYYISDYFDTNTKQFNDKVAVLVYYSNTTDGIASNSSVEYDCNNENFNGPVSTIEDLPTTTQWSNIRLYKNSRQILNDRNMDEEGEKKYEPAFDYSGYSARLLTYQEVIHGCNTYYYSKSYIQYVDLNVNCSFLLEKTRYANSNYETNGEWLETPISSGNLVWACISEHSELMSFEPNEMYNEFNSTGFGARPTIEVVKSEISY